MTELKRIYVDMDGVLCNIKWAVDRALILAPDVKYPQSQYGFFRNMHSMEGACWFIRKLAEIHDVWIATRPSYKNPLCYSEKREWVEKHLGEHWCEKLIIIPDKGLLKGDLLIDDTEWPTFEGKQILFGTTPYENWRKVYTAIVSEEFTF